MEEPGFWLALHIAVHEVFFPSVRRSWKFRRWQWHSIESAQHFSPKPDRNNTTYIVSFILRTALAAMPFVSDRWCVEIRWFHDKSSVFSKFQQIVFVHGFRLFRRLGKSFVNFFPSLEKFSFCMEDWIQWVTNLVPRLRIGDFFEVHHPHWGLFDLLVSSHQISLLEVLNHLFAFCKEPLYFWFACKFRNFGLSGCEYKYCAYQMPFLYDVPNLSHEKWLRVLAFLYLRDYLWTPLTTLGDRAIDFSSLGCYPFLKFSEDRLGFPMLGRGYRHFVVLRDSRCWMSPARTMWMTNLRWTLTMIPGTTTGTTFSVLHRILFPFLVRCGFCPLIDKRALRRACLVTRRQACPRIIPPSRRDQDCERMLVLPHLLALLHLQKSPCGAPGFSKGFQLGRI